MAGCIRVQQDASSRIDCTFPGSHSGQVAEQGPASVTGLAGLACKLGTGCARHAVRREQLDADLPAPCRHARHLATRQEGFQ